MLDSLKLRQQLGEITSEEVSEVNRVLGGNAITGYYLTRSKKEPGLLKAWSRHEFTFYAGVGNGLGLAGWHIKGYNNLWLLAAFAPVSCWMLV